VRGLRDAVAVIFESLPLEVAPELPSLTALCARQRRDSPAKHPIASAWSSIDLDEFFKSCKFWVQEQGMKRKARKRNSTEGELNARVREPFKRIGKGGVTTVRVTL
jgi:hypothetical protein